MKRCAAKVLPVVLVLCWTAWFQSAQAQTPAFAPFPQGSEKLYRYDLARLFFANPALAQANRTRLFAELSAFARKESQPITSGNGLADLLGRWDTLSGDLNRHTAYLSLQVSTNTQDQKASTALDSLNAAAGRDLAWLAPTLAALDDALVERYLAESAALRPYQFALRNFRRTRDHTLSAPEERLLTALTPSVTGWQPRLFQTTVAQSVYVPVQTPQGERDLRRNANEIFNSPKREVRQAGYRVGRNALLGQREFFAFTLARTVSARNALANARRYADFPDESYGQRYLTTAQVKGVLKQIAEVAAVNKRYERAQVTWLGQVAGYDTVHTWDLTLPVPGVPAPRFTIGEAARTVQAATQFIGPDYRREMQALLNPANGRLDLVARENRVNRPGFSTGSVGYPSTFYQGRYEGYLPDLVILAHEGGHAVQNMLMTNAGVRPVYSGGPSYFTESFATFNELLVMDYLYQHAPSRTMRQYYLGRFLDQATQVFKTARESAFEQAMYDSAATRSFAPQQLESLMQRTGARYSLWYGQQPDKGSSAGMPVGERTMEWVNALHFFTLPLYRINYVYSNLLALAYFEQYQRNPRRFAKVYSALLRNGYDAEPSTLLRKFVGIDLANPQLVISAAKFLESKVAAYEKLSIPSP